MGHWSAAVQQDIRSRDIVFRENLMGRDPAFQEDRMGWDHAFLADQVGRNDIMARTSILFQNALQQLGVEGVEMIPMPPSAASISHLTRESTGSSNASPSDARFLPI
jgi:hypothetical protein